MIHHVLQVICKDLNTYLQNRSDLSEEIVLLSEIMNPDGSVAVTQENRLVCSLLNIEQERLTINTPVKGQALVNPPFNLNLYVVFSALYASNNYVEALKVISLTLAFFQGKQVFTPSNTPGLDAGIEKIAVEYINVDLKELGNIWTSLGSKHLPSILFKIRMLSITADVILEELPVIRAVDES